MTGFFFATIIFTTLTGLFVGFCQFSKTFAKDIDNHLRDVRVELSAMSQNSQHQKRNQLGHDLCDEIQFQASTKELGRLFLFKSSYY